MKNASEGSMGSLFLSALLQLKQLDVQQSLLPTHFILCTCAGRQACLRASVSNMLVDGSSAPKLLPRRRSALGQLLPLAASAPHTYLTGTWL